MQGALDYARAALNHYESSALVGATLYEVAGEPVSIDVPDELRPPRSRGQGQPHAPG
jgi:hypothetical protein